MTQRDCGTTLHPLRWRFWPPHAGAAFGGDDCEFYPRDESWVAEAGDCVTGDAGDRWLQAVKERMGL